MLVESAHGELGFLFLTAWLQPNQDFRVLIARHRRAEEHFPRLFPSQMPLYVQVSSYVDVGWGLDLVETGQIVQSFASSHR